MKKKKILVLSPLPEVLVEAMFKAKATEEEASGLEVGVYQGKSKEDLQEAVSDADVIIGDYTFKIEMDSDVIRSARRCLLIQQPSTGYQNIDVDEAARQGIPVANVSGANTLAVAEHTIMFILGCLKKLVMSHEKTKRAEWAQDEMAMYGVFELYGKTLGIIGMGLIGKEVSKRARAFGPSMIYYDVHRASIEEEEDLGLQYAELDDLIARSDVISIHTPLTPETDNIINAQRISQMKPNAVLVNTSRGQVVDEEALAQALKEGRIQGAALDVFTTEPIEADNPLIDAPNTILTPHIAGATNESRLRIIDLSMNNVVSVLSGVEPVNIVNGVGPRFEKSGM